MGTPTKWGPEFLVNTSTAGAQLEPAVARLADGRFIMTWEDEGGASPYFNHAQIFTADGNKAGTEFLVSATHNLQITPQAIGLADGRFIVNWAGNSSTDNEIHAQIFSPDGTKSRGEITVNTQTQYPQTEPAITALAGGRFVVTWKTFSTSDTNIHAQVFEPDGSMSGTEFLVNTSIPNQQGAPVVACLSDGRFVIVWEHDFAAGDRDIYAKMFSADGKFSGSEFVVTAFGIDETAPSIAALANGGFVVSWNGRVGATDTEIYAQIFDANGAKSGALLINTTTAGEQSDSTLAGLPDGRFVAAWQDGSLSSGDMSGYAIRAQAFDADGGKSGAEFLVNTTTPNSQEAPSITVLADGRFVVGWTDDSHTGGDQSLAIRAQIFDPREGAIGLNGTALNDDSVGTKFSDFMKGAGGDDHLDGAGGNDTLDGEDGNDALIGADGYDMIDGGAGDDTALFSHNFNDCTVMDFGARIVVAASDGTDTLSAIEHLQFADVTITPVDDGNALFDTLYYLSRNADVFHAGVNPLEHFNAFGRHEGRDPNALFDASGYLAVNKDVAASGVNPLEQYHQSGWREGRDPGADFDTTLYLIHNPDVAAAGVDPLAHYLQFGMAEGRQAYQAVGQNIAGGFDAQYYLLHNADVAAAGVDALAHFNAFGWHEGRKANAWFDTAGYLAHYADVAASGVNPLEHYEAFGWKEGRDPSAAFDTAGYLAANPDVAAAGVNPLDHFLTFGIYEGRAAVNDGMWH